MSQLWGGEQYWGGNQTWTGAAQSPSGTLSGVFERVNLPIPGGRRSAATVPANLLTTITRGEGRLVATRLALSRYAFSPSITQAWTWDLTIPDEYVAGGDIRLYWGSTVSSGSVTWRIGVGPSEPAATDTTATILAPEENLFRESIIDLDSTNFTAGGDYTLYVARVATASEDTCTGNAELVAIAFECLIQATSTIIPPSDGGTGLYGSGTYGSGNYGA